MIGIAWIVVVASANRASRRSISPPPMMATAVISFGATQLPLRLKPLMTATAMLPDGCPPNLSGEYAAGRAAGAGAGRGPAEGRSAVIGSSSAYVFVL